MDIQRNIYKIGSRWSENGLPGSSIFRDVFLRYDIVYIGGVPDTTRHTMTDTIKEGDLVAIADGYTILAVAEVISPPAKMHQFRIPHLSPELQEEFDRNESIVGFRIKSYILDENDTFEYKKSSKFNFIQKEEIRKKIISLFEIYSSCYIGNESTSLKRNIFYWATKELSQDALLCWIFSNIHNSSPIYFIGEAILKCIFNFYNIEFYGIKSVNNIVKQIDNIDILLDITLNNNKRYLIIIEDKIDCDLHNDLDLYKQKILNRYSAEKIDDILTAIIRTGEGVCMDNSLNSENNCTILRSNILKIIEIHPQILKKSEILSNFYQILNSREEVFNFYKTKPPTQWEWSTWKGFYNKLATSNLIRDWFYVPNQLGGFLCALVGEESIIRWNNTEFTLYLHIDHAKKALCLKVGRVYQFPSMIRDQLIKIIDDFIGYEENLTPPKRKGRGCYMTLKYVPENVWLAPENETINMNRVYNQLRYYIELKDKIATFINNYTP